MIKLFIVGMFGALLYRWRGHASKYKKYFPRPFNQIVFALPYAFFAYLYAGWFAGIAGLGLTTAFVLSGHGNFFPKSKFKEPYEPETIELFILWLKGRIPDSVYKFIGMALSGFLVSLPCAIATESLFIALSGSLKAVAYTLGSWLYRFSPKRPKMGSDGNLYLGVSYLPKHLDCITEIGEFLTGLLLWGSLFILAG
jgi:hypothetical protein